MKNYSQEEFALKMIHLKLTLHEAYLEQCGKTEEEKEDNGSKITRKEFYEFYKELLQKSINRKKVNLDK